MPRSRIYLWTFGKANAQGFLCSWLYTVDVNRFYVLAGILAVASIGCSPSPSPSTSSSTSGQSSVPATSDSGSKPTQNASDHKDAAGPSATAPQGDKPQTGSKGPVSAEDKPSASVNTRLPTPVTAEELFKSIEAKMGGLNHATAHVTVLYKSEKGRGTSNSTVSLVDQNKYRVEYTDYTGMRPTQYALVKNGQRSTVMKAGGPGDANVANALPKKFEGPLLNWFEAFPIQVFSTTWGAKPLSDFLAVAKKSGASIKVEQRQFDFKGHTFHQKHVVVHGKTDRGHTFDIIMVVDDQHVLPVTIDAVQDLGQSSEANIRWTSAWDLQPDQKFDSKLFAIKAPGSK